MMWNKPSADRELPIVQPAESCFGAPDVYFAAIHHPGLRELWRIDEDNLVSVVETVLQPALPCRFCQGGCAQWVSTTHENRLRPPSES